MCFNTCYPVELKPKIYFRKAECFFETGQKEDFDKCVAEIHRFLSITLVDDRGKYTYTYLLQTQKFILIYLHVLINVLDKHLDKLKQIKKAKIKCKTIEVHRDNSTDLPEFPEEENEDFAYASSKVKMGLVFEIKTI